MDESLEYKIKINQIKKQLNRIKELGISTEKYETILNNVLTNIEKDLDESNKKDIFKDAFVSQNYVDGITKLNKLMFLLEEYNTYYKAFNTAIYIDMSLEEEIGPEKINKFVSEMQGVLKSLKVSNHLHFEDERMVIEKVYDVVYKLIKRELIISGNSILLDSVKLNEIDSSFIEELINKDISLSNNKSGLKQKLHELKGKGLESSLLDKDLIVLLIDSPNNKFKSEKVSEFEQMSNNIYKNSLDIKRLSGSNNQLKVEIDKKEEEIIEDKRNLRKFRIKRLAPFVVATLATSGGVFGLWKLMKKVTTGDYYEIRSKVYSTYDGRVIDKELTHNFKDDSTSDKKITVSKYSVWNEKNGREVTTYDVGNIAPMDIKDYALLDETNGLIKKYTTFQGGDQLLNTNVPFKNQDEITIVTIDEYSNPVKKLDLGSYLFLSIFSTIAILGTEFILMATSINFATLDYSSEADRYKHYLKISKEKLSSLHKELESERIKLKFLLESNEELKNKYIDFYNKNSVLLLSERETFNKTIEILEQINSLSLEKVNINRKVLK